MFEQAVLANQNASQRAWSTCAGMTAQALLVLSAALAPVVWPDVLPRVQTLVSLVGPGAPERPAAAEPPRHPVRVVPVDRIRITDSVLRMPTVIPAHPEYIDDPPADVAAACPGCIPGRGNPLGDLIGRIVDIGPPALARLPERAQIPVQPPAGPPLRIRSSSVRPAQPVLRVEPRYPHTAILAHISGPVELEGVIGVDGRIHELRALRGHPLLVPAAIEAVRQWVYAPTLLNGKPVEVVTAITVNFRLTE